MKKKIFFSICILVFYLSAFASYAAEMDKIAAIVNGDVITENEIDVFVKATGVGQGSHEISGDPNELRKKVLARMIDDRLIIQEAKATGIKLDEKMIEERIRQIKAKAGSTLAFEMALREQGISLAELKEKLRNQALIYMVVQKYVKGRIQVSPSEVTEYYEAHRDDFVTPESIVVDSIFVKTKQRLSLVEGMLKAGKPFGEVADDYSEKSELGLVYRGQLKTQLEDVLFSLVVGVPSRPVAVGDGYYVFLLKKKIPPSRKSLHEVKDEISEILQDQKAEKKLNEWLGNLRDRAYISIRET